MTMTRRQFAQGLGAGALLLPFLREPGRAAGAAAVRRIVVVTSIGVSEVHWLPKSSPGAPLVLPPAFAALAPVADHLVYITGLGWAPAPLENHSSPQTLTGQTFNTAFKPNTQSIDQYIVSQLKPATKNASLLLGVNEAAIESHHWNQGARLLPLIDPVGAFNQAFGGGIVAPTAGATALPRQKIVDLVSAQVKAVQGALGPAGQQRLDKHLASLDQLEASLTGTAPMGAGCKPGTAPNLGGMAFDDNGAAAAVSNAMGGVVANALICDSSRIIGMQFGKSNTAFCQYSAAAGIEEHSAVHNPGSPTTTAQLLQCEQFIGGWVANLASTLKATPDPQNAGSTMLDNTIIAWIRDMGDGPNHLNYAQPFALIGGKGYLKSAPGGVLQVYNGLNASAATGVSHQRLLLNLAEFMGVSNFTGWGNFAGGAAATPLAEIKAG